MSLRTLMVAVALLYGSCYGTAFGKTIDLEKDCTLDVPPISPSGVDSQKGKKKDIQVGILTCYNMGRAEDPHACAFAVDQRKGGFRFDRGLSCWQHLDKGPVIVTVIVNQAWCFPPGLTKHLPHCPDSPGKGGK